MTVGELIEILQKSGAPDATIEVSVDVSTCEEDWEHRAYGDEIQEVIHVRPHPNAPPYKLVLSVIGELNTEVCDSVSLTFQKPCGK